MKSIQEFFGKPLSKISKPVRQKFNIYAKYENRMEPREFKKLGDMLFNKKLKGSSQSLAQGLSPLAVGNVKSRYGDKYSIKATSKPESSFIKTNRKNWLKLPDFPQSEGQNHKFYFNKKDNQVLVNYNNEGRESTFYLYNNIKPQTIESMRYRAFESSMRKNLDNDTTIDFNKYFIKSVRETNSSGIQIKQPSWISKVKEDSGNNIKASNFTKESINKRNAKVNSGERW